MKVLLLVRNHPTYIRWLRQQPDAPNSDVPATALAPVGQDGDRRRWFAHTVQAAAAALGTSPPPVSATDTRPVGVDGDPMILTLARGVLAAHSGDPASSGGATHRRGRRAGPCHPRAGTRPLDPYCQAPSSDKACFPRVFARDLG